MGCQVYISYCRGADKELAEGLCGALRDMGAEVGCFEKDLSDQTAMQELYHALDEAKLLILAGTSRANMEEKWVAEEWGKYHHALISGCKTDGEIVVFYDGMKLSEIPFALCENTAYDAAHRDELVAYVKQKLGIPDPPPPPQPKPEDNGCWYILLILLILLFAFIALSPRLANFQQGGGYGRVMPPWSVSGLTMK